MAEVLVSSEDLTVIGGPAEIQLDLNVGEQGTRGTFIMYGLLPPTDPNAQFIATPLIFDLYVLTDPSSDDYLQVFQYVNQDGVIQWIKTFKLSQNFYATNRAVTFIGGEASVNIDIFELGLTDLRLNYSDVANTRFLFNVQATLRNYNLASELDPEIPEVHFPAAVSVKVGDIFLDPEDSQEKLPVTVYAAEFNGTAMQYINEKSVIVHLSVLVVDPREVQDAIGGS